MQLFEMDIQKEVNRFFDFISYYYKEAQDFSLKASYQFRFSHEEKIYNWHFSVDGEEIIHNHGEIANPDITIYTSYLLWLQISSGKKNATLHYMLKSYRIKGPLKYLLQFKKYFGSIVKKSRHKLERRTDPWEKPKRKVWGKPESVLVINASPRMEKGVTFRYLNPFIQGMSGQAGSLDVIPLYNSKIKIEPCRGCEKCWTNGGECILKDDGNMLIQKILESRLTVFAFPLYIDSIPAKLKSLLDRFFIQTKPEFEIASDGLTRHPLRNQRERYFALFAICGFPELKQLKPLVDTFRDIGRNFHAPVIANILRPGSQYLYLNPLMAFERIKVEKALFEAGEELICEGKIRRKKLKEIKTMGKVSLSEWIYYTNMYWENPQKGKI